MNYKSFVFGLIISATWIIVVVSFSFKFSTSFSDMNPNEWGDFLAGVVGPIAIFWLVLGFIQQGNELSNSVKALNIQSKELARSVSEQSRIAESSKEQLKFLEQQIMSQTNDAAYDAYQRFSDRMEHLRILELDRPEIRMLWEGGKEGKALKTYQHPQQFYFVKMLLQANEALFLALSDADIPTEKKGFTLSAWRANFMTDLSAPEFRRTWNEFSIVRDSYDKRFQDEVGRLIDKIKLESAS